MCSLEHRWVQDVLSPQVSQQDPGNQDKELRAALAKSRKEKRANLGGAETTK